MGGRGLSGIRLTSIRDFLKEIKNALTGSGSTGTDAIVGVESFDSSTNPAPLSPSSNGVSGDTCELVIQNTGSDPVWLNTDSNGSSTGVELTSGQGFSKDNFDSTDSKHYVYFPNNAGNVSVVYFE